MGQVGEIIAWIVSMMTAISAIVFTVLKNREDKTNRVEQNEATVQRDTVADRDSFIDQLQEEMDRKSKEHVDALATERSERKAQETKFEARLEEMDLARKLDQKHIENLTEHIWLQRPPPPPARPSAI